MGTRRGSDQAPLSLFAFQDIITSLTGIMILVVLLFVIEASKLKETPPSPPPAGAVDRNVEIKKLRNELAQLQSMVKAIRDAQTVTTLKDRQAALGTRVNDLVKRLMPLRDQNELIANEIASNTANIVVLRQEIKKKQETESIRFLAGPGSKDPVLIVCSGVDFKCSKISAAIGPKVFSAGASGDLAKYIAANIAPSRQCLLLMLKPSSASYSSGLIKGFQNAGYDVGWDALEEKCRINLGLE